jgi:hypothetical protein
VWVVYLGLWVHSSSYMVVSSTVCFMFRSCELPYMIKITFVLFYMLYLLGSDEYWCYVKLMCWIIYLYVISMLFMILHALRC